MVKSKQKKKGMRKPTKEAVSEDGQDLAIDEEPDDIFSDFIARDEEKVIELYIYIYMFIYLFQCSRSDPLVVVPE